MLLARFILLLLLSGVGFADGIRLAIEERSLQPDNEQLTRWKAAFWDNAQEIWAFRSTDDAEILITQSTAPAALKRKLLAAHTRLTEQQMLRLGWMHSHRTNHLLLLSPELRDQVPADLADRYFRYQRSEVSSGNYPIVVVCSWKEAGDFFKREEARLSPENFQRLKNSTFEYRGNAVVVVTPYSWKSMPDEVKNYFLAHKLRPDSPLRVGLDVALKVSPQDSPALLAKQQSPSGRFAPYLEREIAKRQRPGGEIQIPLQELLPAPAGKWVGHYFDCYGPNCFGLAKAFSLGSPSIEPVTSAVELVNALKADGFVGLEKGQPLEMGDVLIYESQWGSGVHSAIYLMEDIVLSRNGFSKTFPTVLQKKKKIEAIYFGDGKFRLRVYRKDPELKAKPYEPLYDSAPEFEYSSLEIYPGAFLATHRRALRALFLKPMNVREREELRRYLHDPRYGANAALAQEVLWFHAEVEVFRNLSAQIGFSPFYTAAPTNLRALLKLANQSSLTADETSFLSWVHKHWPHPYRRALTPISQKFGLNFAQTGVCGAAIRSFFYFFIW